MGHTPLYSVSVSVFLAMTTAAHASVGCMVTSHAVGAESAHLYYDPDDASEVMQEIPLGDIVLYPQENFAPLQADGWIWVRYDATQEDIWQSGIYGWMKSENISDCG